MKLAAPLELDGRLDEAHYREARPISDFIQLEPRNGEPATEKTDVWLAFDAENVYVSMRVWESRPERMIVNEMRRDSNNIRLGESIWFAFDTFHDRRNAYQFEVNPLGGRTDAQSTNERQYNADYNLIWDLSVGTFDGGWTLEAAIPFKSMRYGPGALQTWGFQARRNSKWKNEISFLTHVPASFGLSRGSHSASIYPETIGLEAPPASRSIEIKPYAIADLTTDRTVTPAIVNDPGADVGLDVKIGVTQGLTADLTYNTDFAQVEADEQQVNLTRFSLFFPEKREFFTENQGTFTFGGAGGVSGVANGDGGETPLLFYSRRIGLENGREVPILGGARLTGRIGATSIGVIDMQTRDEPAANALGTNFLVLRVKRDILRRSAIGALVTSRSLSRTGTGSNQTVGVDATFGFFRNLSLNTFVARTMTEGLTGDDMSYRAQLDYAADRYGVQLERLSVGNDFNPEVGFVRRYRHPPQFRAVQVQSAAAIGDGRAQVLLRRLDHLYRERRGPPRDAHHRRRVRRGVPEQRPAGRGDQRRLRVPEAAVRRGSRLRHTGGRLFVSSRGASVIRSDNNGSWPARCCSSMAVTTTASERRSPSVDRARS